MSISGVPAALTAWLGGLPPRDTPHLTLLTYPLSCSPLKGMSCPAQGLVSPSLSRNSQRLETGARQISAGPRGLGHPLFPEGRKNDIHSVKSIRQQPGEIQGRKEHVFPKDCFGCFPGEGVQGEGGGREVGGGSSPSLPAPGSGEGDHKSLSASPSTATCLGCCWCPTRDTADTSVWGRAAGPIRGSPRCQHSHHKQGTGSLG